MRVVLFTYARYLGLLSAALILLGCQGGEAVSRNEFNGLSKRVDRLEGQANYQPNWQGSRPSHIGTPPLGRIPSEEKRLYQQGQNFLKQKRYDQAANIFTAMLKRNPAGYLAPNARYWLGESHYAKGLYQKAAIEFQRCANDYPQSDKAPDALLKLSYCHDRLGDGPKAMSAMEALLNKYPSSNAANMVKSGQSRFHI